MDKNYIRFFIDEDKLMAKIHKNGTSRLVRNKRNINKLIEICSKHGYKINDECFISRDVLLIAHDYERYLEEKKKNNLQVTGNIKPNMKVSRKNQLLGKVIVGATLTILLTGLVAHGKEKEDIQVNNNNNTSYETQINEKDDYNNDVELIDGQNFTFKSTDNPNDNHDISYDLQEGEDIVEQIEKDGVTVNIIGDESENQTEEEINKSNELTNMLTSTEFHYEYPDKGDSNSWDNVMRYDDIFEKYANDYGVDKVLLEARAAQETNGDHYGNIEGHPAIGLMQIEKSNFGYFQDGTPKSIKAYNFTTGDWETIDLTDQSIAADLDTNIKLGAIFTQYALQRNNYNILVGTQEYNMGCGNMDKLIATCSSIENIPTNDLRNNLDNQEWLKYRESVGAGDSKYIEHVFRYIPNGYTIKTRRIDTGDYETLTVFNDYQNTKEY